MDWTDLLAALGLAIVIEGLLYALFPDGMRRMMVQVMSLPAQAIRLAGLVAALFGLILVWMIRG